MSRGRAWIVDLKCDSCGGDFSRSRDRIRSRANYCSRDCYRKAMAARNSSGAIGAGIVKCDYCGRDYARSRKNTRNWMRRGCVSSYCSHECSSKGKTVTKLTVNHGATGRSNIRNQMIRCGKLKECERCGYRKNLNILQIHHRDRNKTNNSAENLAVLCPNCHAEEHYGQGRKNSSERKAS